MIWTIHVITSETHKVSDTAVFYAFSRQSHNARDVVLALWCKGLSDVGLSDIDLQWLCGLSHK